MRFINKFTIFKFSDIYIYIYRTQVKVSKREELRTPPPYNPLQVKGGKFILPWAVLKHPIQKLNNFLMFS